MQEVFPVKIKASALYNNSDDNYKGKTFQILDQEGNVHRDQNIPGFISITNSQERGDGDSRFQILNTSVFGRVSYRTFDKYYQNGEPLMLAFDMPLQGGKTKKNVVVQKRANVKEDGANNL
jgi:hypothetical protein